MRRNLLGVSQQQLANALGLTFQQVQKYEHGANRISASKLYGAACLLKVPVDYFFEGLEGPSLDNPLTQAQQATRDLMTSADGLELARGFPRIPRKQLRGAVLELVRVLADED